MLAAALPEAMGGWLRKRSSRDSLFANWNRRFAVIELGKLSYFKNCNAEETVGVDLKGWRSLRGMEVFDEDGEPFDMDELSVEQSVKPMKIYLMSTSGGDDLLLEIPNASLAFEWVYAFQQHSRFATLHPDMMDPSPDRCGPARTRSTSQSGPSFKHLHKPNPVVDKVRFQMKFATILLALADENIFAKQQQLALATTDSENGIDLIFSFVTHSTYDSLHKDRQEHHKKPPRPSATPPTVPTADVRKKRLSSVSSLLRSSGVLAGDEQGQEEGKNTPPVSTSTTSCKQRRNISSTSNRVSGDDKENGTNVDLVLQYDVHPGSWFIPNRSLSDAADKNTPNPYPNSEVLPGYAKKAYLIFQVLVTQDVFHMLNESETNGGGDALTRLYQRIRATVKSSHGIVCAEQHVLFRPSNSQSTYHKELYTNAGEGAGESEDARARSSSWHLPLFDMPLLTGTIEDTSSPSDATTAPPPPPPLALPSSESTGNSLQARARVVNLITSMTAVREHTTTLNPKHGVTLSLCGEASLHNEKEVATELIINVYSDPLCNFIANDYKFKCEYVVGSCATETDTLAAMNSSLTLMTSVNDECDGAALLVGEGEKCSDPPSGLDTWTFDIVTSDNIVALLQPPAAGSGAGKGHEKKVDDEGGKQELPVPVAEELHRTEVEMHTLALTIIGGRIRQALKRYANVALAPNFEIKLRDNNPVHGTEINHPFKVVQFLDVLSGVGVYAFSVDFMVFSEMELFTAKLLKSEW